MAISYGFYILIIGLYMTYFFSTYDNKLTNTYVKKNWKFFSKTDEFYHATDRRSSERLKQGDYKKKPISRHIEPNCWKWESKRKHVKATEPVNT